MGRRFVGEQFSRLNANRVSGSHERLMASIGGVDDALRNRPLLAFMPRVYGNVR
jgi:hypothetical protein